MPVNPTYPGVYVEEVASGVRPIVGVSTSVTAFVGPTKKGPVDEPVSCFSFGHYQREFGDLWEKSPMSYTVQDFFANGGSHAIIVRIYKEDGGPGVATFTVDNLNLVAANPGKWAEDLRVQVTHPEEEKTAEEFAKKYGLQKEDLFDLQVLNKAINPPALLETFRNVTTNQNGKARRIDRVLKAESKLVGVKLDNNGNPELNPVLPAEGSGDGQNGSDGGALTDAEYTGNEGQKEGIYALLKTDIFNLLCIPPADFDKDTSQDTWSKAAALCERRRAFLIADSPRAWETASVSDIRAAVASTFDLTSYSAVYYPHIRKGDPLRDGQLGTFVPCGAVAGVIARTDVNRGVWKAAAGTEASLRGVRELTVPLNDQENGQLNPVGVNCLRTFPVIGRVVWGARTLRGADSLADDYKYAAVRRLALFIEESLFRGTQWVVFEPNDEPLWAQIRLNIGAFMQQLFRQGAFQGQSPREAYLVKCDKETTTQADINLGIVNILVGFAPLQPAEFVIIKIQQIRNAS